MKNNLSARSKIWFSATWKEIKRSRQLYVLLFPTLLWFLIFFYRPIGFLQIAFKDFNPLAGAAGSPWVGWKHFEAFFSNPYAAIAEITQLKKQEHTTTIILFFNAPIKLFFVNT